MRMYGVCYYINCAISPPIYVVLHRTMSENVRIRSMGFRNLALSVFQTPVEKVFNISQSFVYAFDADVCASPSNCDCKRNMGGPVPPRFVYFRYVA